GRGHPVTDIDVGVRGLRLRGAENDDLDRNGSTRGTGDGLLGDADHVVRGRGRGRDREDVVAHRHGDELALRDRGDRTELSDDSLTGTVLVRGAPEGGERVVDERGHVSLLRPSGPRTRPGGAAWCRSGSRPRGSG